MVDKFNPEFPKKAKDELDDRAKHPDSWMYKKYAHISMQLTGKTASSICVEEKGLIIGDSTNGKLYNYDSGVRLVNPTLQSVKVVNSGNNGDYTNSYLYEIEASFKVYSLDDMNRVEKGFFRLGAEVKIAFGWKGKSGPINNGEIFASIYNFGFTMASDGSYDCNIKAMSAAALFGGESMAGEVRSTDLIGKDESTDRKPFVNIIEAFYIMAKKAFGILPEDGVTVSKWESINEWFASENSVAGLHGNQSKYINVHNYDFVALELETPAASYNAIGNDVTVLYTTLGSFVQYLNKTSKENDGLFEISISSETTAEGATGPTEYNLRDFGSSNPYRCVIPDSKPYGVNVAATTATINEFAGEVDVTTSTGSPAKVGIDFTTIQNKINETTANKGKPIAQILLNIDELLKIYDRLHQGMPGKDGTKHPPKTKDFLDEIFNMIENDTSGVTKLQTQPINSNPDEKNRVPYAELPHHVEIINRGMIPSKQIKKSDPYVFKVLTESSILRNVSLQSDFDTDLLVRASKKSIKDGSSNMAGLSHLYPNCGITPTVTSEIATAVAETKKAVLAADAKSKLITADDIMDLREDIGYNGWTQDKSISLISLVRKYLMQKSHLISVGSYGEVPMMLKLGVTIDGITGVKYMSPISIDRMPAAFKKDAVDFAIISIEHSFDGQGDWSTSYETVMRIK